ncbi:hypothetical protein FJTKL_04781 [Diaporthe vaccinii]|uniref:Uncharacterized protein n=1 Tax=Diaporthe vaccinii TaxID=105482 RepID=A0ABR4F0H1_9PEZI
MAQAPSRFRGNIPIHLRRREGKRRVALKLEVAAGGDDGQLPSFLLTILILFISSVPVSHSVTPRASLKPADQPIPTAKNWYVRSLGAGVKSRHQPGSSSVFISAFRPRSRTGLKLDLNLDPGTHCPNSQLAWSDETLRS